MVVLGNATVEACGIRDVWSELQRKGAVVLGVSPTARAST
jgi:peroxiredoxin